MPILQADVEEYLAHYGVEGMQWRSVAARNAGPAAPKTPGDNKPMDPHQAHLAHLAELAHKAHLAHVAHLAHLGNTKTKTGANKAASAHKATLAKAAKAITAAHKANAAKPQSSKHKAAAAAAHASHIKHIAHMAIQAAKAHAAHLAHLAHVKHDDTLDLEEFIAHFGVKGMKWGVRRFGRDTSPGVIRTKVPVSSSEDHQRAALVGAKAKKHGGIHSLSNDELKVLTSRLNLENDYARLVGNNQSQIAKGRSIVKETTSYAKTGLDAYNTGKQAYDAVNEVRKLLK